MSNPVSGWKPGDLVEYAPSYDGPWFPCVIDSEPWMLSGHTEVVRLRELSPGYAAYTKRNRTTVSCAEAIHHVRRRTPETPHAD